MSKLIALVGAVAAVVLAAVVVPAFVRARNTSSSNACVMHLRQIAGAKEQWVIENHGTTNDVVSWSDIKPYLSHEQVPQCPDGGTYILGRVAEAPRCSLAPAFAGGKSHELPK
jgi:hypothetical protein